MTFDELVRQRVIGILQTALAFMYEKGFRPRGEAKHYNAALEAQPGCLSISLAHVPFKTVLVVLGRKGAY